MRSAVLKKLRSACLLTLFGGLVNPASAQVTSVPDSSAQVSVMPESSGCSDCQAYRAALTPNMFGDIPVNPALGVNFFQAGTSRQISGFITTPSAVAAGQVNATFAANLAGPPAPTLTTISNPINFLGQPLTQVPSFTATAPIDNVAFPTTVSLLANTTITGNVQALFAAPGETATFNASSQGIEVLRNLYNIFLVYDLTQPGTNVVLALPNPVDGGLIGRTKVSTDNNPLPRDRVIFNYDYLNNTPVVAGGQDISRVCVGLEKAFFDGRASVEIRMPFASTVNNVSDGSVQTGSDTAIGNLHLTFKALAFCNETMSVSGGLGVSIPTANDTHLRLAGVEQVRIENDAVLLTPFAAALFTPSDNLFAQAWVQYGIDTNGNPVLANVANAGLQQIGRLTDPDVLQLDCQVGFWLIRPSAGCGLIRGLAPFGELHYNNKVGSADLVSRGQLTVTDSLNGNDELNVSAGLTAQLRDNLYVTAGVTLPLKDDSHRSSDYQIGIRMSWFFGCTADARAAAIPQF